MSTWLDALQALGLLVLAVQVWRLTRAVRELAGSPRPRPVGRRPEPRNGAAPAGSFATLLAAYLELFSRSTPGPDADAAEGASPASTPAPAIPGSPAAEAAPDQPVYHGQPPSADGFGGLAPDAVRVVELLRQGLTPDEVARRLDMGRGEVQVLERLARAKGLL